MSIRVSVFYNRLCLVSSGGERFAYTEDVRGSKP
jgi:hypothetical protein